MTAQIELTQSLCERRLGQPFHPSFGSRESAP